MSSAIRLILSTFPDEATAVSAIRSLLDERLTACGSILPGVRSIYRWREEVEDSREVQVVLKTSPEVVSRCMARLAALHPYEVPEIIELDPATVSGPYAAWVRDSLSRGK